MVGFLVGSGVGRGSAVADWLEGARFVPFAALGGRCWLQGRHNRSGGSRMTRAGRLTRLTGRCAPLCHRERMHSDRGPG